MVFGFMFERGHQHVELADKHRHIGGDVLRMFRRHHLMAQRGLPVITQRQKLRLQVFAFHRLQQIGAVLVNLHLANIRSVFATERHFRQQPVTLHTQRTGLIDGVGIAFNTSRHPRRHAHAAYAQQAEKQHQQGDLADKRERRQGAFEHQQSFRWL